MGFWLSHHGPDGLHRTYRLGHLHVCARCLGVYPALLLTLLAQFLARAPLAHPGDAVGVVALTMPGLVDWAYGQLHPQASTNLVRTLTGALLGLSLGRSLYVHIQAPWPLALVIQLSVVTAVAAPVLFLVYRRTRSAVDPRDGLGR